jgi:hypothetical protein
VLRKEIEDILSASKEWGWVLEPEAKRLLALYGFEVPRFKWAGSLDAALQFASETGYPLAAKVVSPKVLHKSDAKGVMLGIDSDEKLEEVFLRFSRIEQSMGILIEEMVSGLELILGAKMDYQFGPVILVGMGGTGVEIYKDASMRMAPLSERDAEGMLRGLKARQLLDGFRGSEPVNRAALIGALLAFSSVVMDLEDRFESIDLNPLMCSSEGCFVADARIVLSSQ